LIEKNPEIYDEGLIYIRKIKLAYQNILNYLLSKHQNLANFLYLKTGGERAFIVCGGK
jgi:hypothetical protein